MTPAASGCRECRGPMTTGWALRRRLRPECGGAPPPPLRRRRNPESRPPRGDRESHPRGCAPTFDSRVDQCTSPGGVASPKSTGATTPRTYLPPPVRLSRPGGTLPAGWGTPDTPGRGVTRSRGCPPCPSSRLRRPQMVIAAVNGLRDSSGRLTGRPARRLAAATPSPFQDTPMRTKQTPKQCL